MVTPVQLANLLPPAAPGEVRNPKGRGKGSLNTKTILKRCLAEKEIFTDENGRIVINEETGKSRFINQLELMIRAQIKKARKGDVAAFNSLIDRLEGKVLPGAPNAEETAANVIPITLIPAPDCLPLQDGE